LRTIPFTLQTQLCLKFYPEIKLRVGAVQPEVDEAVTVPEVVEEVLDRAGLTPTALQRPHHLKTKATLVN
jgi:hypothetical protein